MRSPASGELHNTAGYPPVLCARCHHKLLYGMWLGVYRCHWCKQDNTRTLDDLRKWMHTQGVTSLVPESREELSG
jgi:DNA-directed RNA polymerase subunit RPC12/RpoP